jgi:hypothetical protein
MKNKVLSVFLCLSLTVILFSACGKTATPPSVTPKSVESVHYGYGNAVNEAMIAVSGGRIFVGNDYDDNLSENMSVILPNGVNSSENLTGFTVIGQMPQSGICQIEGEFLSVHNNYVYFVDGGDLFRLKTDASACQRIGGDRILSYLIDNDTVYYTTENEAYFLWKMNLDGSKVEPIAKTGANEDEYVIFAISGQYAYLSGGGNVIRVDLSDGTQERILTQLAGRESVFLYKDCLYYLAMEYLRDDETTVNKFSLNSSDITVIYEEGEGYYEWRYLNGIGDKLFFVKNRNVICSMNLDGSHVQEIYSSVQEGDPISKINIVDEWIYFGDSGALKRVSLDGTKNEDVFIDFAAIN